MNRFATVGVIAILSLLGALKGNLSALDIGPMTWTPRSDWINMQSCSGYSGGPNAVGDGVADDTIAIQDVLNQMHATPWSKLTVYFPPGTYKITNTLIFSQMIGVQFIGCGSNTTIKWAGASGGAMFWSDSNDDILYTGFEWDGSNLAGCAYEDNNVSGGYGTNLRHENESFKNFTVTGNYTYTPTGGSQIIETAPAAAYIGGFKGVNVSGETMFYNCVFNNCTNGIIAAYQQNQNYMWHVDGCEFESCVNGISFDNGGCFMVDNCHFQGSTGIDIIGGFSVHVRHCTSSGSNQFYAEGQDGSVSQDIFQDCWIDSWTGAGQGPIIVGTYGAATIFDCVFTNPPVGAQPPIQENQNVSENIFSNNYAPNFAGGTGLTNWNVNTWQPLWDFIPTGIFEGSLTSASQTFLKTTWPADSTHISTSLT